jgi:hypothetical protein
VHWRADAAPDNDGRIVNMADHGKTHLLGLLTTMTRYHQRLLTLRRHTDSRYPLTKTESADA